MIFFLVPVSALMLLSSFPVARANLDCHFTIDNTDVCNWSNNHAGLVIAALGGIAALLMFSSFLLYSFRPRNVARQSPRPISYGHSDSLQVSAYLPPQHPPLYTAQAYPFSGHGQTNQNGPAPNVTIPAPVTISGDPSKQPYARYAPPQRQSPAYAV
ncbi:hypothetical protein BS17DRAFT_787031 [Gyrodon lividus]|nr:hypothetical protein BS17DRAFT_787031 [Gyrodon lividus]